MPNQLGQAYGLTVLSPIKPDAHADAVRTYLAVLNGAASPFSKVKSARGHTVHTARWVVLDELWNEGGHFKRDTLKSKYLLFDANFDTDDRGLAGFLEDMARAMPKEIVDLYEHCVGFTSIEEFPSYIERCQIETTLFFVDYAEEERGKVVNVWKALAARADFIDVAARAQSQTPREVRASVGKFLETFNWTAPPGQIVAHVATAPQRDIPRQRVDVADVQGNVLRSYKFDFARHLYFRVTDARAARASILALSNQVDHSGDWGAAKPPCALNLAFSYAGLAALGVPDTSLESFPIAFRMGMKARAVVLGDTGPENAPADWEEPFRGDGVHVLVSVYADSSDGLADEVDWVKREFSGAFVVGYQDAARLEIDGVRAYKEHFGFTDGLGTTDIDGAYLEPTPGSGKLDGDHWTPLAPGELLFGYKDEANEYPDSPVPHELAQNGTFVVYRKLRENVTDFRTYLKEQAKQYGDEELLAAKMVGRFRDGTPLALSDKPDPAIAADPHKNNDFRYGGDPDGAKCPLGAHIRRARPRDALGFDGRVVDRRRIQRRGMPYGSWLPEGAPKDDEERGIVFMAFNIDIERQFEFIQQQWLNYGNSFRQGNDKDILTGNHDGSGKAVIQATPSLKGPFLCTDLPRFVDMRGGEYFFMPGIRALRWLGELQST